MKKILTTLLLFVSLVSLSQMRNDLSGAKKSDLINYIGALDHQGFIVLGESSFGDSFGWIYGYDANSTATVDGELVLDAVGMGVGRFIRMAPIPKITITTTGSSGASTYNISTGTLNIPQYIGNTYTAGTGIGIASNVITNSLPDQTVTNTGDNGIICTGTYPNFTIAKTKRQETYTGTTAGSGTYSVTYGTAFSVAPNVQFNINGGSTTNTARLTASSNTGFTITANNRVEVLGLLPTYPTLNGLVIDILVTEK